MIKAQCDRFLNTPPLWENRQYEVQQFEFPRLNLDSFQPIEIPQNIRLGHQMEYIFKQLIEYSQAFHVLVYNLPIRQGKRTLGEIDFILEDIARNKIIHIELTYKFYIINPEISEPIHRLIGPNNRDTFFAKMEKIKKVQFPLLHSEEAVEALNELKIDHARIEHQCCFKSQLFQPYGSTEMHIGSLNKDCLAGYWLRFDDLNSDEFVNTQFYMPSKFQWVIDAHDQVNWKSLAEILIDINLILHNKRSPLLWLKTPNGAFLKLFVIWW